MASSCSPSSSAVTIPIPGKSILKRPNAQPASLLSRITRFLPTQNHAQTATVDERKTLKRAHFILPKLATVYPISSLDAPSTPTTKDEKKAIEEKEAERRKRIVKGEPPDGAGNSEEDNWWSLDKVESFYRECCAGSEEEPDPAISFAFKNAIGSHPRSVDFSGVQLDVNSAGILADVFTIEWGLRKLVLRECNLDDHILKPILHALLIPNTLSFMSVASNARMKAPAFRLIGAYTAKARNLQFLDLSQNAIDKKSAEFIVTALSNEECALMSLRLDGCSLRPAALECLARAVRVASLRNISLRHNRINATGAVALALMIRDYPDVVPSVSSTPPSPSSASIDLASSPTTPTTPPPPSPSAFKPHLPPPRHPPLGPQTTYTPYVPRSRRSAPFSSRPNLLSSSGQPVPIITSSPQGGVTTRHPVPPAHDWATAGAVPKHSQGPSAALLDKVRALDALPRVGALRTLDLKGNDLRSGIAYIAQVLKRNRTLKVLNLSENKLDVHCLVSIAEALKYNSTLETLDLSKNPCSGPGLEGIQSLRTAFTINTALKRLFLSSTSMTSPGAIALAEFLPESTSLLHLDLTMNNLDIAGVMALSSGLKANHTMRCLDLNIPPGDEEFARMCRHILNSCVRNTEEAEKMSQGANGPHSGSSGRGLGKGVWGMIEDSELAKSILQNGEQKRDLIVEASTITAQLRKASSSGQPLSNAPIVAESVSNLAKTLLVELSAAMQTTSDPVRLEELLRVNDELASALGTASAASVPSRPTLTLQGLGIHTVDEEEPDVEGKDHAMNGNGQAMHGGEEDLESSPTTPRVDKGKGKAKPAPPEPSKVLSPTFLIESDDEDPDQPSFRGEDEEEGDVVATPSPTDRSRIWIQEEGEVFRKGTVLLGPEEMEGDYAGEELRRELLDAMVERPPPRSLDDFDISELAGPVVPPPGRAASPINPSAQLEPKKPPSRPYVSRSRSSSTSPKTPNHVPAFVADTSFARSPIADSEAGPQSTRGRSPERQ